MHSMYSIIPFFTLIVQWVLFSIKCPVLVLSLFLFHVKHLVHFEPHFLCDTCYTNKDYSIIMIIIVSSGIIIYWCKCFVSNEKKL